MRKQRDKRNLLSQRLLKIHMHRQHSLLAICRQVLQRNRADMQRGARLMEDSGHCADRLPRPVQLLR